MFIDLHMHEMRNSGDSFLALEEIVEIAKKKGLDAICITDHDSMDIRDFAQEYSRKTGFPIFVGIEFYSLQGDIIAYGVRDYPRERVSAQEFSDLVREQGGVCYSAHPFRNNRRGMEEHLDEPLTIPTLSRRACLSATTFKEEFRRLYGLPVHTWLRQRRMERAAELLHTPGLSLETVAQAVGYSSVSQFAAAFRRHYGVTPGRYRKNV